MKEEKRIKRNEGGIEGPPLHLAPLRLVLKSTAGMYDT